MAVTRLEIRARGPYADGAAFGEAGAYERIDGTIHFAVDPAHPANALIVDLDKAARDDTGQVRFSADFCLLQPVDAAKGNRRLLFEVLNRGANSCRGMFNHAAPTRRADRARSIPATASCSVTAGRSPGAAGSGTSSQAPR